MWKKREQIILWFIAYLPLLLIMGYQFIDSLNLFYDTQLIIFIKKFIDKSTIDFLVIVFVLVVSIISYRLVVNFLFKGFEDKFKSGNFGNSYYIRKYEKLSVNDYSFFLITLMLPLITLDYTSVINFTISLIVILFVILVYVKTDSISVCPVFFLSNRYVYKAVISNVDKSLEQVDPSFRKEVFIITIKKNLDLNKSFKVKMLVKNVYYVYQED